MTPEPEALARRAVACRGWRWMPGMLMQYPARRGACGQQVYPSHSRVADLPEPLGRNWGVIDPKSIGPDALPDLTDPATLGCLLALVREAWGDPLVHATPQPRQFGSGRETIRWRVRRSEIEAATEAEALVGALEAAP